MPPRKFREDNGNDGDWEMTGQGDLEDFYNEYEAVDQYQLICELGKLRHLTKVCIAALCNPEYRGNIHMQQSVGYVLDEYLVEGITQLQRQVTSGGLKE